MRVFLFAGLLGVLDQAWWAASEIEGRYTWPAANGRIVSSTQRDDSNFASRSGSLSQRTQYWVEYEVEFAVPEDQCTTGTVYVGASETVQCHGIVRTRRTRSTRQAFQWIYAGYALNTPVIVLHNLHGPQVKIADSSIWIFYAWLEAVGLLIWVIGFWVFHAFFATPPGVFPKPFRSGDYAGIRLGVG